MKNTKKGFTLIELLVVIAIIGILAAVTLSSLNTARENTKVAKQKQLGRQIQLAMEMYYQDNGHYNNTGNNTSNCNIGGFGSPLINPIIEDLLLTGGGTLGQVSCLSNLDTYGIDVLTIPNENSSKWCADYLGYSNFGTLNSSKWSSNSVAVCDPLS